MGAILNSLDIQVLGLSNHGQFLSSIITLKGAIFFDHKTHGWLLLSHHFRVLVSHLAFSEHLLMSYDF